MNEHRGGGAQFEHTMRIEGWRGISHSYALVNQWQILEFLRMPGLRLLHRDAPYSSGHWKRTVIPSGFAESDQAVIDALPDPPDAAVDSVLAISSPFHFPKDHQGARRLTFMVTEFGLDANCFTADCALDRFTAESNLIVAPSNWARDRIAEFGFDARAVHVVPHGVNTAVFHPTGPEDKRVNRRALGIEEDVIVFLNVGAPIWNKGVDLLVNAFARVRRAGRRACLIMKEQLDLYNLSSSAIVGDILRRHPDLITNDVLGSIKFFSANASFDQLRALYNIADCYVSPYRAEGFNLPVLESIACGVPVIVTEGGATDDFCSEDVAVKIRADLSVLPNDPKLRFLDPRLDDLVGAMDAFCAGRGIDPARVARGREIVVGKYTWRRAAATILDLARGAAAKREERTDVRPLIQATHAGQRRLFSLLGRLRPLAMGRGRRIRLGNDYDGGYVLPDMALKCDVVVSISAGPDVSFDAEFARRGATVLQFDHTVEATPESHPNFIFHRKGWGVRTEGEMVDLAEILGRLDALGANRTLLKFDIEGGEYDVLAALDRDALSRFDVVVCELHDFDRLCDQEHFDKVERALRVLTEHHAPVHLHINNYQNLITIEGAAVPPVIEVSLLRKDLDRFSDRYEGSSPLSLDRPNDLSRPDICLNPFLGNSGRTLHIYCDGGLGNRINALLSGLATARATGLRPLVVWPLNNWCRARFGDLFDRPLDVVENELHSFVARRKNIQFFMHEDRLGMAGVNVSPLEIADIEVMRTFLFSDIRDVLFYTALIPPYLKREEILDELDATPFRAELTEKAARFVEAERLDGFVGLHVRQTDFGDNGANVEALRQLVEQRRDLKFFICSDSPEAEAALTAYDNAVAFPKGCYVAKMVDGGWNESINDSSGRMYFCNVDRSAESVLLAAIDLLILSRSEIVTTSGSTFLSTAKLLQEHRKARNGSG